VKVTRVQRRRLRYLITARGMAEKARLTVSFLQVSMRLYRETREAVRRYLAEIRQAGYGEVHIEGDNDLAEVCYLTCLEQGVQVVDAPQPSVPTLRIEGMEVRLAWPEEEKCLSPGVQSSDAPAQIQAVRR